MSTRELKKAEPSSDTGTKMEKQADVVCKQDATMGKEEEEDCCPTNSDCESKTTENNANQKDTPEIRTKDKKEEPNVSCPGSSSSFKALKKCHYEGCTETTERSKVKTWLCKRHRNKLYKDTYKKKKTEPSSGPVHAGDVMLDNLTEYSGDEAPIRQCNMLEQVLNEKKLTLLQSPEVQEFFRQQQQKLGASHQGDTV